MECTKARRTLSEYIDGVLDKQSAEHLEGHLEECEKCRKEHISLKRLINEIGLMDPVEAPKDLLEKIKDRLEASSPLEAIRRFLFFPAGIKIPLELTTLAATAVLVLLVFNMIQPDKRGFDILGKGSETKVAMTEKSESREKTVVTSSDIIPEKEGAPIRVSLILEPKQKEQPLSSENVLPVTSGVGTANSNMPELSFWTDNQIEERTDTADLISYLNEIIILSEGQILPEGHENYTGNGEYLNVEIPSVNYRSFISKLEKTAVIKEPAPPLPDGYRDKIILNIRIESLE